MINTRHQQFQYEEVVVRENRANISFTLPSFVESRQRLRVVSDDILYTTFSIWSEDTAHIFRSPRSDPVSLPIPFPFLQYKRYLCSSISSLDLASRRSAKVLLPVVWVSADIDSGAFYLSENPLKSQNFSILFFSFIWLVRIICTFYLTV